MKKPKSPLRRAGALVLGAAIVSVTLVGLAVPASAVDLGTVTLSQTSGNVNTTPIFTNGTTSAPCPATFGEEAALRIGPANTGPFANLAPAVGGGGFDQAPVSIDPNRSFTTALGAPPADGEWWVVVECFSLTAGRHPDRFVTRIQVTGATWQVITPPVAQDTTTSLAASPASPQPFGTVVNLTATVTPSSAVGSVEFRRGALSLGSVSVSGGTATLSVGTLPVGTHSLTAHFTATDPAAFNPSSSPPLSYQITSTGGGGTSEQTILADISPGEFTLVVNGNQVLLNGGTVGGSANGSLNQATVTDLRGSNAGWDLTGSSSDFSGPATIAASNLGWVPTASRLSGSGTVVAGATVTPGVGNGLGATSTLCNAAGGSSAGRFTCAGQLNLNVPDNVPPGTYQALLTLTLA